MIFPAEQFANIGAICIISLYHSSARRGRCWWYRCDRFPISLHSTLSQSCYTRQRKLIPFFSFIRHPLYRFHSTGIYMAEEVMHLVFSPRLKKNWMCHFGYLLHSIFAQVSRESFCRVLFILYSRAELVPSFISHTRRAAVTKWKVLHSLFSLFAARIGGEIDHTRDCAPKSMKTIRISLFRWNYLMMVMLGMGVGIWKQLSPHSEPHSIWWNPRSTAVG